MPIVTERAITTWQPYITVSTSALAGLGVIFGALVPLIDWLDAAKAMIWAISCLAMASFLIVVAPKVVNQFRWSAGFKDYAPKIMAMGALWALFPYLLCATSSFSGDPTKNCVCAKLSPDVKISIQKHERIFKVEDKAVIQTLLDRAKRIRPALPVFQHPHDVDQIINAMRQDRLDPKIGGFIKLWDADEAAIKYSLLRLLADFSSSPLAASQFSNDFFERMKFQMAKSNGMVLLTGDEAIKALKAISEHGVSYKPAVDDQIVEAATKLVAVSMTRLYSSLQDIPTHYVNGIDPDFVRVLRAIPNDQQDLIHLVAYQNNSDEVVEFECGNPARGVRQASYSRFYVPRSVVQSKEALEKMRTGPWPIGRPDEYFSEDWWLNNAIWQMLARERRQSLDNLALRISEFNTCGPP